MGARSLQADSHSCGPFSLKAAAISLEIEVGALAFFLLKDDLPGEDFLGCPSNGFDALQQSIRAVSRDELASWAWESIASGEKKQLLQQLNLQAGRFAD